jgi:DNA-binding MarR family transcriptional regulator
LTNYYDDLFVAASGLRATQITPLVVLYLAGPQTIHEIAGRLGLDRTTLTRNLRLLEDTGLLDIEPGDDQRTRLVTLTGTGRKALRNALPVWERAQAQMVQSVGQKRFQDLLTGLTGLAQLAREELPSERKEPQP